MKFATYRDKIWIQGLIFDDVMSSDLEENPPDQVLKYVLESGVWGGCAPMCYTRVNFCNVLR